MKDITERLFVYGSLMPGHGNYLRIKQHVRNAHPGIIEGVLVDLGAYPALIPGEGMVRGILLEVDDEALVITDRLEGYHPDRSDDSLYIRKKVQVRLDNGLEVDAWTYEYAHPKHIIHHPRCSVDTKRGIPVYSWKPQSLT